MEKVQEAVVSETKQIIEQLEKTKTALDTIKVEKAVGNEAKQIAEQLEKTKTALNKKIKQLNILHRIGEALTLQLDIQKLLTSIIRLISQKTLTEKISIMLVDKKTKRLQIKAAKGVTKTKMKTIKFKIGEGVAGWVAKEGKPILIKNTLKDPRFENIIARSEKRQFICVPMKVRGQTIGVINVEEKVGGLAFTRDDLTILTTIGYEAAVAVSNALLFDELQQSYFNTITALVKAMEAKEPYTQGHSDRVKKYASAIAREVNLSDENIELIKRFGALHDIGKIGIPIRILNKPGKLTREEWKIIKSHPRIGVTIIETIDFMKLAKPIILSHHERYDGKGYPMRLRDKKIPLLAKIFSIADAYDAMLSDRPYRKAFSKECALAELARSAGTQFDPRLAKAAIRVFKKLKE
ncbi:MAG: HD domain-containing protein [bacterium]|nr:HD domain-containing protein [bacterium]